jgi:hypothetical protein
VSPVGFSVLHGGADIYYLLLVLGAGAPSKFWGIGVSNFVFFFPWAFKSEIKI